MNERLAALRARLRTTAGHWTLLKVALVTVETLAAVGVVVFILSVPLTDLRTMLGVIFGLLVAFAVLSPGTAGPLVLVLSLGTGYVMTTMLSDAFGGALPPAWQVLLIAVALYLIHAIDTLRATLPVNAAIDPSVVIRWLRRLAETLVPTVVLGVLILAEPTRGAGRALWFVGAVALLAAVGMPSVWMRRKPWLDKFARPRR